MTAPDRESATEVPRFRDSAPEPGGALDAGRIEDVIHDAIERHWPDPPTVSIVAWTAAQAVADEAARVASPARSLDEVTREAWERLCAVSGPMLDSDRDLAFEVLSPYFVASPAPPALDEPPVAWRYTGNDGMTDLFHSRGAADWLAAQAEGGGVVEPLFTSTAPAPDAGEVEWGVESRTYNGQWEQRTVGPWTPAASPGDAQ